MLQNSVFRLPVIRLLNRVLSDYPAARQRLQMHQGKVVAASVGPVVTKMRVTVAGEMELVGETGPDAPAQTPDVSLNVPLSLLPALAAKDPAALSQIVFTGDSELAATLSDIARNIDWDIEADLSRVVGDAVAHRVISSAQRAHEWHVDAGQRFTANVAEYLTEERRAFITARELEALTLQNESMRDDIARLAARVVRLSKR